jgi:hypothetical protein
MHSLMDITLHSILKFKFAGSVLERGWIESIVYGDTRTGKSKAAQELIRHYGGGEIISCEAASFAGIVGGLQQIGGREWTITWGVVPLNDRRAVVLDEVSGLTYEEISSMSDVRSSGVAKLTKIQQEVTFARTRLLWISNPRGATMGNFTYGVDALRPLIGNAEDIARFDLAMCVTMHDVDSEEINRPHEGGELRYTSEACHSLLMWAWTRAPEQVVFARGAEDAIFKSAVELGKRYVEEPPLVQAANVREKIARVAVAIAARLFATDETGEKVIVSRDHVDAAVAFMDHLYKMPSFGYADRSKELLGDRATGEERLGDIKQYLWHAHDRLLAKFLRGQGKFRRQDLEEILNIDRTEANAVINTLWEARMVRKDGGDIRVEPILHRLLREVQW